MNRFAAVTIVALSVALVVVIKKHDALVDEYNQTKKDALKIESALHLMSRVVMAQYHRPDGAGILIPPDLRNDWDAFQIFLDNGLV